jgi:hypothetical protein
MTKLKEFDKVDWYGFAGAEEAPGKPPMIRSEDTWMGVCDINGVDVYVEDKDETRVGAGWYLRLTEYKYPLGKFILESLPETVNKEFLEELGFVGV